MQELVSAAMFLDREHPTAKVIIITGEGQKARGREGVCTQGPLCSSASEAAVPSELHDPLEHWGEARACVLHMLGKKGDAGRGWCAAHARQEG